MSDETAAPAYVEAAVARFGPDLSHANTNLREHFPEVKCVQLVFLREENNPSGSWIAYAMTQAGPGYRCFLGKEPSSDPVRPLCEALQRAADAGLYREIPPPPAPPEG